MPISALTLPTGPRLPWGQALNLGDTLDPVVGTALFNAYVFANRDRWLYYRDVQLATSIAQVAKSVADVWGVALSYPIVDAAPAGSVTSGPDLPSLFATPGAVSHVDASSVPLDAATTDAQLYARDSLLYWVLWLVAQQFQPNPLTAPSVTPSRLTDAWSMAQAWDNNGSVSVGRPLNIALFKNPDQGLAWRDNFLAAQVAAIELAIGSPYARASRLTLLAVSSDGSPAYPEPYNLITSGTDRVWSAYPLMPGHLELTFDLSSGDITWTPEEVSPSPGGIPAGQSFLTPTGSLVQVVNQVPIDGSPSFYRWKSSRLVVRPWTDQVVLQTTYPNLYLTGGPAVYQPDSILLTSPGAVTVSLPALISAGYNRLSFLVRPDVAFSIYGSSYQSPTPYNHVNGTAVTLTASGFGLLWTAQLPLGDLYFTVTYTDQVTATPVFPIQVFYNGTLIFDGSWAFGLTPGTAAMTPPVRFTSAGGPSSFEIVWVAGQGQLTIETINFESQALSTSYSLSVQVGTASSQLLTLQAVPGRPDVAQFDVLIPVTVPAPTALISWTGGAGFCLYIDAFDVTVFQGANLVENWQMYEAHKARLLQLALAQVRAAYSTILSQTPAVEFRTPSSTLGWVWDAQANARWVGALDAALSGGVTAAFKLAGPADLGRPALIPQGLTWDGEELAGAAYGAAIAPPVLHTLQAWMLYFNPLVAGPDFWPQPTRPGASQPALPIVADFSVVVVGGADIPASVLSITATATATVNGVLISQPVFTAWNYANAGPGGGSEVQAVTVTAGMGGLSIGTIYTLILATTVFPLSGASYGSEIETTFTATATNQQVVLPLVTAPSNSKVEIDSITLS